MNPSSCRIDELVATAREALANDRFVKLSLGGYKGADTELKNLYVKKVVLKGVDKLAFTYRYKTRDIAKNFEIDEGLSQIDTLLRDGFMNAALMTLDADWHYQNFDGKKMVLKKSAASHKDVKPATHDREKARAIKPQGQHYLHALELTDANGNVYKSAQDKYRQINHYIAIVGELLKERTDGDKPFTIIDMGAGKGYLTFALADHVRNNLQLKTNVIGVEQRAELVTLCNKIAVDSGLDNLSFATGTIADYKAPALDMLIALHACNTATDDAIAKGILANAEFIVVAPCCHKQIRQQIEKNKNIAAPLQDMLGYGVFLERQAEMVTDAIRALILNYFGYSTKVLEFVSDAHTPKNVMIIATKNKKIAPKDPKILAEIEGLKNTFGIEKHYLEDAVKATA